MKFGPVPLRQATGAILAHSIVACDRPHDMQLTYRIAKGTVLTAAHVQDLEVLGHREVVVAIPGPDDVAEDEAATRLAQAIVPAPEAQEIRLSAAGAGRVNLYAMGCGIVSIDAERIQRANAVDPMIGIATVPQYHRVDGDSMIATIKIISYAVDAAKLQRAMDHARSAMRILPPVYSSATLIETATTAQTPPDKGRRSMAARIERMGMMLDSRVVVPHDEDALAQAVRQAAGEVVLILTGSATSDPEDVAPTALRRAGGNVVRFGMPVDPGNLLFVGRLGAKPVVGLPGCARSPALNGADWVLERLICGVDVSDADIAAMGVGGLLKEIPTRPQPRRGNPAG